jgi:hypothetical protein
VSMLYRPFYLIRDGLLLAATGRAIKIGLIVSLITAVLTALHLFGFSHVSDELFFDAINLRDFGRPPKVIIVRSDAGFVAMGTARHQALADAGQAAGVKRIAYHYDAGFKMPAQMNGIEHIFAGAIERIPARGVWQLKSNGNAAALVAAPGYGIYRQQLAWVRGVKGHIPVFESAAAGYVPAAQSYFVRLSHNQNLPQLDASQIINGSIDRRVLKDMILLVEPLARGKHQTLATARGSGKAAIAHYVFSAAAIQTLADRREVTPLGTFGVMMLMLAIALLLTLIYVRYDVKRVALGLLCMGIAAAIVAAVAAILFANLLLPVTAMVLLQLIILPLILQRTELDEDRRLRRFVTRTVNLASRSTLMKDVGRIPDFLTTTSSALGIKQMALLNDAGQNWLAPPEASGAIDEAAMRQMTKRLGNHDLIIDGQAVAPDWTGEVRLAPVGSKDAGLYWLYALPPGPTQEPVAKAAASAAASYRQMQSLRSELSAGRDQQRLYHPVDEWAGGAVELISEQNSQIAAGVDQLDTAVIIFHQIGFPLHANDRMAALYEVAGLSLAETDLPSAIAALTTLDRPRIDALLHELLLFGGEMRVHCRDFGSEMRNLRIAASRESDAERPRTIIIEAIDITDLKYLAELNLSVGTLLNIQLRNDLEALALAAAMAKDERLPAEKRKHVLGQVEKASNRARGRLDDVAMRFRDVRSFALTEAYPLELATLVQEIADRSAAQLRGLNVALECTVPAVGGYVVAEPRALGDLIEAILQIVGTDTLPGDKVYLTVTDDVARSIITITGGIGMAFDQIYRAIDSDADDAPAPFKAFASGLAKAVRWGASVTYSSGIGKGYRFNIDMRRIG